MEDTPVLKWTLAALGVIVACFCLGYFVLGPTPKPQQSSPVSGTKVAEAPGSGSVIGGGSAMRSKPSARPGIIVEDQTAETLANEARLKKLEEENRKLAEELRQQKLKSASPQPAPTADAEPAVPTGEESPVAEPSANPDGAQETPSAPTSEPSPIVIEAKPATPEPRAPTPKPSPTRPALAKPAPTPEPTKAEPKSGPRYRVQVGAYDSKQAAENIAGELRGRGFSTSIVSEESGSKATFHVQVGAFNSKTNASTTLRELQVNGYEAKIIE